MADLDETFFDDSMLDYLLNDDQVLPAPPPLPSEPSTSSSTSSKAIVQISDEALYELKASRIPINTNKKVNWIMRTFFNWHNNWKIRLDGGLKVFKNLDEMTLNEIDFCLQYFIPEIRKTNGDKYPPQTYKEIFAGVQHYLNNQLNIPCFLFKDPAFLESRKVLDAQMKLSASEGNVNPKKRKKSIDYDQEDQLWQNGAFGSSNPRQLLETLIYHLGLHFSLRAGQEHRDLVYGERSQMTLKTNPEGLKYIHYVERASKNKKFGIKDSRRDVKETCVYENVNDKSRCVVLLYETYISHRPDTDATDAFYLTPKAKPVDNIWYKCTPYGIHSIEKVTKKLMTTINDNGSSYSNTSLRRTAQMRLLNSNIPMAIAQKKTGRLSESATSAYIEADKHEKGMSSALYSASQTSCCSSSHQMISSTSNSKFVSSSTNSQSNSKDFLKQLFGGGDCPNQFVNCNFTFNMN